MYYYRKSRQELIIDLLQRLPKFNPERAKRKTFITRVVMHKVATIIEARKASHRDYRLYAGSLNDYLEDENGNQIERGETVDQDDYFQRMGRSSRPLGELHELSMDTEKIIADLPPKLRGLCERLKRGEIICKISREMGIDRATVYRHLKALRKVFEEAEFKKNE